MAIIKTQTTLVRTALQRQADSLQKQMQQQWTQLGNLFKAAAKFIWSNPKPQDAFDAFGTDAADLFKLAGAYRAMAAYYNCADAGKLAAIDAAVDASGSAPASAVPTGWTYVRNDDGTVTAPTP